MMPNLIGEQTQPNPGFYFGQMRTRIEHIATLGGDGFGGAFVIVPPEGDPISTLIVDERVDLIQFWSLLRAKADIALEELKEKERQQWKMR